ncbi:MAG: CPBP family intramembrane metalloprotease [Defluviitaleaceae bacterium]|nr:CPBP family intramembrane metalloprotease [Defluviitaleaceae bacterium]
MAETITMYTVFLSLLFVLIIIFLVVAALAEKKYKNVVITEKIKCRGYYQSISLLWIFVFVVMVMCIIGGISLENIGLRSMSFNYNIWFTIVILTLSGLAVIFFSYQTILLLTSAKAKEDAKKQISMNEGVGQSLPQTKKEKWLFSILSLSAGICEEIIFRGFLVFLLQAIFPDISILLIILMTSVTFGIFHLYQGFKGVIKTGIFGAFLMCLVLVTDSLIIAMLLHFLLDFSSTFLLSEG